MKSIYFFTILSISIILEVIILFFLFYFDYSIYKLYKEGREISLKKIEYYIQKQSPKIVILNLRDYLNYKGKLNKELLNKITPVLKESILTKDSYFLANSIIDKTNRPEYLRISKLSQDPYIRYISSTYYYVLVSKEFSEALGSTYKELKNKIPNSYKWIVESIEKPILNIAKSYMINKLKKAAINSQDDISKSLSLAALISIFNYYDEEFYINFLSTNTPILFVISTIGLSQTGENLIANKQYLKNFEKYTYFINNKEDLYKYYSTLLIIVFTDKQKATNLYKNYLDFDVLKEYKDITISIVMLNYLFSL
ncbi:MAG: hypothetical protein N2485_06010 [bacterium]|nr:hypothetical protein [bacterium]